jgi:hypothetical protein
MLGKFMALHRLLNDEGRQLAFCYVNPFFLETFKIAQVSNRVPIHADETQALQALAGA